MPRRHQRPGLQRGAPARHREGSSLRFWRMFICTWYWISGSSEMCCRACKGAHSSFAMRTTSSWSASGKTTHARLWTCYRSDSDDSAQPCTLTKRAWFASCGQRVDGHEPDGFGAELRLDQLARASLELPQLLGVLRRVRRRAGHPARKRKSALAIAHFFCAGQRFGVESCPLGRERPRAFNRSAAPGGTGRRLVN